MVSPRMTMEVALRRGLSGFRNQGFLEMVRG